MGRRERRLGDALIDIAVWTQGSKPSFWITVVSVFAAGFGALLINIGLDASDQRKNWWFAGAGIVLAVLALALQVVKEGGAYLRSKADAEDNTGTLVTIKNALHPVVEAIALLTQAQEPADKSAALQQIAGHIVQAPLLIFEERREVRAVLYRKEGNRLRQINYSGRGRTPRDFTSGDERGRKALEMVRKQGNVYIPDINSADPALYGGNGNGYQCFISVTVHTPYKTYGMLTVDTPELDAFDQVDVETVRLLADLAAVAMAIAETT